MDYLTRNSTYIPPRKTEASGAKRTLIILGLIILVGLLCFSVYKMYRKRQKAVRGRDEYRAELARLSDKESQINASIGDLSTDAGIEHEIRERYRVVKPGEQLILVIDNPPTAESETTTSSIWFRITHLFSREK